MKKIIMMIMVFACYLGASAEGPGTYKEQEIKLYDDLVKEGHVLAVTDVLYLDEYTNNLIARDGVAVKHVVIKDFCEIASKKNRVAQMSAVKDMKTGKILAIIFPDGTIHLH